MNRGAISMMAIFGIATTVAIALSGYFVSSLGSTNNKVEKLGGDITNVRERTSKLEEAVETIKKDNSDTRKDIKEFLIELNKRK